MSAWLSPSSGFMALATSRRLATAKFCTRLSTNHGPAFSYDLFSRIQNAGPCLCVAKDGEKVELENQERKSTAEDGGSGSQEALKRPFSSKEMMEKLKRYGVAGVLSYGLLNTVYYLTAFLIVWLYLAPAPGKMGYAASVKRFLKIMAAVWAGSQVTKLLRAGGALALAPLVDKGLSWFTAKFKFNSKGKAFAAIAGGCFGLAFVLFIVITLLWA
ncbi:uncharacterized protein LOC144713704 isoform X2 [Wolffia australiana]